MAQQTSVVAMTSGNNKGEPSVFAATKSEGISLEEMLATIRRLEERVKELEAKLQQVNGNGAGVAPAPASDTLSSLQVVQQDVATLKDEYKKNAGFLSFFRTTEISGFVDTYYGYNFNRPKGDTQLRNFDTKHNQFGFNLAELALEKKPTEENRLGFRMDLNFGPATEIVHSLEPGGSDIFRHFQQGYLSYLAPLGKGLQVDVGKFVTQHGAEVIETKDNWNYSRSLLFALAIPYYHFGARATYPVSDKVTLAGYVVNGWNNVVDNNQAKTYGVQAIVKPADKLTFIQNYMGGPEQANNDRDWRHLWDSTLIYNATPSLSLMANYDYGFDTVSGARVHWQGLAAYARYQVNNWFALAPRFEWYDDNDGFTTGTAQQLKEFTLTSEFRLHPNFITRFEVRRDFSDTAFFMNGSGRLKDSQPTALVGFVIRFNSNEDR